MNLQRLFKMQSTLDKRIITEHNLYGAPLLHKKILALQVEMAELANETRCFKFWSTKEASSRAVILEEYVDCIHFILSIGLEKNYVDIMLNVKAISSELSEQFLNLYTNIASFITCPSADNYLIIFENFLGLGENLGFSIEDIEGAYLHKNNINHERQNNGY